MLRAIAEHGGTLVVHNQDMANRAQALVEKNYIKSNASFSILTIKQAILTMNLPQPILYDNALSYCAAAESSAGLRPANADNRLTTQVNTRVTDEDAEALKKLNDKLYDGEAKQSLVARLAMRKGIEVMKGDLGVDE